MAGRSFGNNYCFIYLFIYLYVCYLYLPVSTSTYVVQFSQFSVVFRLFACIIVVVVVCECYNNYVPNILYFLVIYRVYVCIAYNSIV